MKNAITWFEIPTTQLDRAQAFYEAVLGQPCAARTWGLAKVLCLPTMGLQTVWAAR